MIQDEQYRPLWRTSTGSVEEQSQVEIDRKEEERPEWQRNYDRSDDAGGLFGDENGGLDPGSENQSEKVPG